MYKRQVLDNLYLDGSEVTFDATKVLDANDSSKYRLELWNCYGATKNAGCAFGTPDGDVIKELGFSTSMEVKFTFHNESCQQGRKVCRQRSRRGFQPGYVPPGGAVSGEGGDSL